MAMVIIVTRVTASSAVRRPVPTKRLAYVVVGGTPRQTIAPGPAGNEPEASMTAALKTDTPKTIVEREQGR